MPVRNARRARRRELTRLRVQKHRARAEDEEHVRALRRVKQRRYRALKANGQVVIRPRVDPADLAEFLHEAGVMVRTADRETLALGVEALLAEWDEGLLRVTRIVDQA